MKKFISIFIACAVLFAAVFVVACDKGTDSSAKRERVHDIQAEDTNIPFIRNMSSRYSIVIPSAANESELFAAEELQTFMEAATGYRLDIVSDDKISSAASYVSVGDTAQFKSTGLTADDELLRGSGFRIVTEDKNVYIFCSDAYSSEGVIYGVYEFLHQMIGYRYYSKLEAHYEKTDEVYLKNFNVTDVPDFEKRYINSFSSQSDLHYAYRMRMTTRKTYSAEVAGHTHFTILPYEVYGNEHPDWYNRQGTQLCLSNEEMTEEFIKQLKVFIERDPNADLFYITLMDFAEGCDCEKCTANIKKYGTYGGVNNVFINKVSAAVDEWLAENYPERHITYRTYAYYATQEPPVKYDQATDTYTPYHPDVVLRDNVQIQLANLAMSRSHAIDDPVNITYYNELRGWSVVSNNLAIYLYGVNYSDYFFSINDFNVIADSYPVYFENNVTEMYDASCYQYSDLTALNDLKAYCKTRLWWDSSLLYDDLVDEFLANYYQEAQEPMRAYYELYRVYIAALETKISNVQDGYKITAANFPKTIVDKFDSLLQDALAAAAPVQRTDPERYERLCDKIAKERLMTSYMYLSLYQDYFTTSSLRTMIDEFEEDCNRFNVLLRMEGQRVQAVIDGWRANL